MELHHYVALALFGAGCALLGWYAGWVSAMAVARKILDAGNPPPWIADYLGRKP